MTKLCMCCLGSNDAAAETCVMCGQASWPAVTEASPAPPAAESPVRTSRKAASK